MKSLLDKARETASQLGTSTRAVLETPLHDIDGMRPLLTRAGFALRAIEIELGITPKLVVAIQRDGGDLEALEALADDRNLTATQRALVSGLRRAFSLEELALRNNFRVGGLKLGVGVPPSVSILLAPIDADAAEAFAAAEPELDLPASNSEPPPASTQVRDLSAALPIQDARDLEARPERAPRRRRAKRRRAQTSTDPSPGVESRGGFATGCLFLIAAIALIVYLIATF